VCPPEAAKNRRVNVILLVRETVVVPVVPSPPKNALLNARLRPEREKELEGARRLERSMREIPVVAERDPENPDDVGACAEPESLRRRHDPERPNERQDVERQVRPGTDPIDPLPRWLL
jgi:hypothetical protein